jgi:AcrR family transcriptional regulator
VTAIATATSGRTRILEEAANLFVVRGYAETSLRGIAAAAGMKAGSVYYHFESKDRIIEEVLREGMTAVEQAFDAAADRTAAGSPQERLTAHVGAHLEALFAHGAFTAAHVTMFHTVPDEVREVIVPLRDRYERRWADLLEELAPSGSQRDVGLARLILIGAMNSSLEWYDPEGSESVDGLAAEIVTQFWRGFGDAT